STLQSLAQGAAARHTTAAGGTARPAGAVAGPPAPAGQAGPVSEDLFAGEVKITADKNINSLVVIASQADYRNLVKVVERLDIRPNALQSSSDVNVISTPHVIMTDNTEGEITVGQNVPFQAAYAPTASALTSLTGTGTTGTTSTAQASLLGLGGLGSLYAPI